MPYFPLLPEPPPYLLTGLFSQSLATTAGDNSNVRMHGSMAADEMNRGNSVTDNVLASDGLIASPMASGPDLNPVDLMSPTSCSDSAHGNSARGPPPCAPLTCCDPNGLLANDTTFARDVTTVTAAENDVQPKDVTKLDKHADHQGHHENRCLLPTQDTRPADSRLDFIKLLEVAETPTASQHTAHGPHNPSYHQGHFDDDHTGTTSQQPPSDLDPIDLTIGEASSSIDNQRPYHPLSPDAALKKAARYIRDNYNDSITDPYLVVNILFPLFMPAIEQGDMRATYLFCEMASFLASRDITVADMFYYPHNITFAREAVFDFLDETNDFESSVARNLLGERFDYDKSPDETDLISLTGSDPMDISEEFSSCPEDMILMEMIQFRDTIVSRPPQATATDDSFPDVDSVDSYN